MSTDWRHDPTTWRQELSDAGVTEWIAVAPDESALDEEFDAGFGSVEGPLYSSGQKLTSGFPPPTTGRSGSNQPPEIPNPTHGPTSGVDDEDAEASRDHPE